MLIQEALSHQPLNSRIFKQLRSDVSTPPLELMLKGLAIPTLIVWGADDRVLHRSGAKILASVMTKARAAVMDGVGHLAP